MSKTIAASSAAGPAPPLFDGDAATPPPFLSRPTEQYADGRPYDHVQYIEAKLVLKPDRFTSVQSFRDFGRIAQKTAKQVGVSYIEDERTALRPEIREIVFIDTEDFRLYSNAFILRRRIPFVDGFAVGDPEMVLKYRKPEERTVAALDVRPKIAGEYRIKLKAEILPLRDQVGGYRVLYSHNCQFGLSQMRVRDPSSLAALTEVFPTLAGLAHTETDKVSLVNGGIVEEVLLPLGELDFGKGMLAKCDVALWRTRGEHTPLVGEFAFQAHFPSADMLTEKQRSAAAQYYVALQKAVTDWLALGVTKTGVVYALNGHSPTNHE